MTTTPEFVVPSKQNLGDRGSEDLTTQDRLDIKEVETQEVQVEHQEPATGRWELWSWYAYSFGNNSMGTLSYAPLIFQSVLYQAGFNGNDPTQDCSDSTAPCSVKFGNSVININTVVLLCNGIAFAFQAFVLIFFGSMSDYGSTKRYVLIGATLMCWGSQFSFLGITESSKYREAAAIFILSSFSYNICSAFWLPGMPLLARNTRRVLAAKQEHEAGEISDEQFAKTSSLERNRLANFAYGWLSAGQVLVLLIALGAAFGLHANDSTENNMSAARIIIGMSAGLWILCGTPWFILEKQRAPPLPKGETYFSVGAKATWQTMRHANKLNQTWLFLVSYFLITDGSATTAQIYALCQNTIVAYSTTTSTQLYIVQSVSNAFGIVCFWLVQKHWKLPTKYMFIVVAIVLTLLAVWGCIGIGTTKFGLHNVWEVWVYSFVICFVSTPFFALSASLLTDLCPKGREVTFFAVFALVSRSTSWIGPVISGVIIDHTGSTWTGFPFALGLTFSGLVLLCFVNVEKGQRQCEGWVLNDPTLN